MLSINLTAELERRLGEIARSRGQSEADVARDLIEASIDDFDDVQTAVGRLEDRRQALTAEEARKALGLDD